MNDELRRLQAPLERATARGDAGQDALDAETAALREGWLALGQILENVDAGLEPSFGQRLREAAGTGSLPEAVSPTLPPTGSETVPSASRGHRARLLPLLAAAAAVLLVVITVAWRVRGVVVPEGVGPGGNEIAKTLPAPKEPQGPSEPEAKPAAVSSPATEFAWDDPLDGEIESAGRAVLRVEQQWHALADASTAVQYQLQQLSQEFGENRGDN